MSADREALISLVAGAGVWIDRAGEVADALLESEWLAEHDREVQAETLRRDRAERIGEMLR